jgi:hypothetical protein
MAPAKSSSTLPVAPVASAFEASAREVAAIVPATDVGDRSARDALGHADDAVLERVPDSLPPPPPPGAEDADEGSTVMLPAPDVSIGPTAAGSGDAGRFEDVAAVPAAAVFHEPEVALPRMAAAVKPTQRARPEANASRRGRSVVVSLVVLLVVWGVAFGLYVRDRGKKRAEASTVVATAADAASPSPASGAPAAPLPSESGASTVLEALATASAAVAPSALASSEGASEARDPGGASSSAPSAASSSGALPPIIDAPGADRKLLSFEAHLVVRSSVDANVYVQGVVVGRTNQRTIARCRWRNVRLGVEPGPFWISKLQTEHLPCEGSHTVTIETDPGLVAAERARSR